MPTITFEDYKKAIKAKYEEEKNGEYSNNLNSPTSANLRNLCIKRFETNNSKDDLITFKSFFDFPFDRDNRNLYGEIELNKLTAVRRFLLNVTESPAEDTVQLAAILVDLQPRPFKEFQKQLDPDEVKLIEELRDTNHDKNGFFSDILPDKVETEKFPELKNDEVEKDKNEGIKQDEAEEVEQDENQDLGKIPTGIFTPIKKVGEGGTNSGLKRSLIIAAFLLGLILIVYLNMSQKDCMQWMGDHYEKIERSDDGYCDTYYDARYFDLKKIEVCDTTEFFDDIGRAKVWYIKIGNSVECYNQHAPYPENTQRFLKPITQHIIDKYLSNRPKCN
ncbi:hypothetical protein [Flavobacterium tyrosinilyticum]|uniref:hypothetical protein n=1 Tax=Flavobacterium tyrosinilyticum TaxID=1658740 RepID=UPI0020309260|nr:hypothetical protein [Flavobacterium tyrosinilyticum]MCM0668135.1 hypothetical protein [Flavobacterium tyrosinilyticum]